jgi:hypothetical protein
MMLYLYSVKVIFVNCVCMGILEGNIHVALDNICALFTLSLYMLSIFVFSSYFYV